mmetsp:Transcript_31684/g.47883  ORF Transcript_31684/g.47883 Transcript_31684/m.47883 type:complete len:569 (-) Transcript_31684:185-1891(-)|eukprot:CAMPEP_0178904080 /NCGR_PEP_ID=MMETSP0786-20121207/5504_1 /TAXON_ID=186022 /ORGANISM="Thalassionema frauenfeldii, Strain CCMP 1798" /LENGTH=568 /DNA_ID=CAMNT_0020575503 /DNA_START=161 /DNA_END=1867 /DNA_ORIENTATION=-
MEQTYDSAVAALMSPLHQSQTPEDIRRASLRRKLTISDMRTYLDRIQLPHNSELHCKNMVHITGTKGKGSVAALCEGALRAKDGLTTGLFTSPHLVNIRERIRIDGRPVSEPVFGMAYWEIRRRFDAWRQKDDKSNDDGLPFLPGYFRMLTLMAVFIFANYTTDEGKKIDVAIFEVGMGGRYDATNIFDHTIGNVVCGVTLIDYDHIRVLGSELGQIAWEKGGIFLENKEGSERIATTRPSSSAVNIDDIIVSQTAQNQSTRFFTIEDNAGDVINMLRSCAFREGKGETLGIVMRNQALSPSCKIGLVGDHQRINAELAVALSTALVKRMTPVCSLSSSSISDALRQTFWPGRCQSVSKKGKANNTIHYRCDGAHTPQSLVSCLQWFRSASGFVDEVSKTRILLFNCQHERNPVPLLDLIQAVDTPTSGNGVLPLFDKIFFCKADFGRPSALQEASPRSLLIDSGVVDNDGSDIKDNVGIGSTWQDKLAFLWKEIAVIKGRDVSVSDIPCTTNISAKDAIGIIEQFRCGGKEIEVCVTGSLYLVGSVLNAVGWREGSAKGDLSVIPRE